MAMKRWTLAAFLGLFSYTAIQAQQLTEENFYEYKADQEAYFDSLRHVLESDGQTMKGTGYKSFQSHLHVWDPLVYPQGDYRPVLEMRQEALLNMGRATTASYPAGWVELGPFGPPEGRHVRHLGTGRITSITFSSYQQQGHVLHFANRWLVRFLRRRRQLDQRWNGFLTYCWGRCHRCAPAQGWLLGHRYGRWRWRVDTFMRASSELRIAAKLGKTSVTASLSQKRSGMHSGSPSLSMHPRNPNIVFAATNKGLFSLCQRKQCQTDLDACH